MTSVLARFGGGSRRRRILTAASATLLGVLAGGGAAVFASRPAATITTARAGYLPAEGRQVVPAPDFTLTDQTGHAVSLSDFRGRTVLVTFMDPRCTAMCPVIGRELAALEQRLPAGSTPALLVVSVAGNRTAADVTHFTTGIGWRAGWHWLLGNQADLAPVWAAYHIAVQNTPSDVLHDQVLYVVDPRGRITEAYAAPLPIDEVAATIQHTTLG